MKYLEDKRVIFLTAVIIALLFLFFEEVWPIYIKKECFKQALKEEQINYSQALGTYEYWSPEFNACLKSMGY